MGWRNSKVLATAPGQGRVTTTKSALYMAQGVMKLGRKGKGDHSLADLARGEVGQGGGGSRG